MEIRFRLEQLDASLRGLLLYPRNEADMLLASKATTNLAGLISGLQDRNGEYADQADLIKSLRAIATNVTLVFNVYSNRLIGRGGVQDSDPKAAIAQFVQSYPPIADDREKLLSDFEKQVNKIKETNDWWNHWVSFGGGTVIFVILIASFYIGAYQSSSVSEPLSELVEALERMRHGDFTKRLNMKRRDEFGVLADGLNRLADDLSVLVGQVQRSGIQVNTNATEIAATAREQQSTANEIAATTARNRRHVQGDFRHSARNW